MQQLHFLANNAGRGNLWLNLRSSRFVTKEILSRWVEYWANVYNFETDGDPAVPDFPQILDEKYHPILRTEVEAAVKAMKKKGKRKSRECHNHKPQPFPDPKRKRKPTNPNKHKSNKRTKNTKISILFPKRGNRNTKRTEKHKNKMTHWKTYNKLPRRINHKATKSKTNTGTTALERSVE